MSNVGSLWTLTERFSRGTIKYFGCADWDDSSSERWLARSIPRVPQTRWLRQCPRTSGEHRPLGGWPRRSIGRRRRLADTIDVWAFVNSLGRGLSLVQSVQFALAGDFFDTLSPAGPVSSEPIMARFIGVATETSYSDALAVRTVAKYVKSGMQLVASTLLCLILLLDGSSPHFLAVTLGALSSDYSSSVR